jgi:hypothetical protein
MPFDTYLKMYQESQKDIKNLAQQGKWTWKEKLKKNF